MNEEPPYTDNTVRWKPGDLVIHRADVKDASMLRRVVGYAFETGLCITVYEKDNRPGRRPKRLRNDLADLLDPALFQIENEERQ